MGSEKSGEVRKPDLGIDYEIKDVELAERGKDRVNWAWKHMPVLRLIYMRFKDEKPLKGVRISACLHVTTETANLLRTLKAGGAQIALAASNPLSTQDDVAAYLVMHEGISVFAYHGEDTKKYYEFIEQLINFQPDIIIDDGADLISTYISKCKSRACYLKGATEETTTGVLRLRNMERDGVLPFPVIAVNNAKTKMMFDNRYGTGQSVLDGIMRATNILLAGKRVVVAGYGWCGRGIASRARGMGALVIVTEVDPVRALEAVMDGYTVMSMIEAAPIGDIFITATGNINVISKEHFEKMKDGAILANAGHFNVEIDVRTLEQEAVAKRRIRDTLDEYILPNGKHIYLVAEGRLVNLVSAEGHPPSVMDMSFSNQALAVEYLVKNYHSLPKRVLKVVEAIDEEVARLKLISMGVTLDVLTDEQQKYLTSWTIGTS